MSYKIFATFSNSINYACKHYYTVYIQDIHHEEAPTGDLYAVTDKKPKKQGSKKQPSEDELAQMYSVPDKTKKHQEGVSFMLEVIYCTDDSIYYFLTSINNDQVRATYTDIYQSNEMTVFCAAFLWLSCCH